MTDTQTKQDIYQPHAPQRRHRGLPLPRVPHQDLPVLAPTRHQQRPLFAPIATRRRGGRGQRVAVLAPAEVLAGGAGGVEVPAEDEACGLILGCEMVGRLVD